ncbi:50S ribosomal L9 C-terminal domain-containing protein, partial [Campylobacter coli]|uniref:50S ribosomal L9 C-terminal domain-containing protein n=1 Tax=Campylobacter coli TaxID=195 RepID=UPI002E32ADAA
ANGSLFGGVTKDEIAHALKEQTHIEIDKKSLECDTLKSLGTHSLFAFWGLMFVYLWAGGHHLIYSTVPDWMQTMGSVFSVVLIL